MGLQAVLGFPFSARLCSRRGQRTQILFVLRVSPWQRPWGWRDAPPTPRTVLGRLFYHHSPFPATQSRPEGISDRILKASNLGSGGNRRACPGTVRGRMPFLSWHGSAERSASSEGPLGRTTASGPGQRREEAEILQS